ncbi:hypothetical protein D3C80_1487570 [compost metagenome]
MPLDGVADVGAQGPVVHLTEQRPALLACVEPAPFSEDVPRPQAGLELEPDKVALEQVFQPAAVQAQGQVVERLVIDPRVVQAIAADRRRIGALLRHRCQVFVVGRVPQLGGVDLQRGDGEVFQVLADQLRAVEPLREQAAVVSRQQRQQRAQAPHPQLGFGQLGLERGDGLAIVIDRTPVAATGQQPGAAAIR